MNDYLELHVLGTLIREQVTMLPFPIAARFPPGTVFIGSRLPPGVPGLQLESPTVSRRHAELSFAGAQWHLRDMDSDNGIWRYPALERVDEVALRGNAVFLFGYALVEIRV